MPFEKFQSAYRGANVNWRGFLGTANGIASARWGVQGNAALPALSATATGISGTTAYAWFTGGVPGTVYTVEHAIWMASGGRQDTAFEIGVR